MANEKPKITAEAGWYKREQNVVVQKLAYCLDEVHTSQTMGPYAIYSQVRRWWRCAGHSNSKC